jgi:hypothetical protein
MANISGAEAKSLETEHESATVISFRVAKLLKLRHTIKQLREEVLTDISCEIHKCKQTCNTAKILIGEINDTITEGRR